MNQPSPTSPATYGLQPFDLGGPYKPLTPRYTPLRAFSADPTTQRRIAEENAAAERARQERRRMASEYLTAAKDEWQLVRTAVTSNVVTLAVLDLHHPDPDPEALESPGAMCAECEESDGFEATKHTPWPCRTYAAIKQAAVHIGNQP